MEPKASLTVGLLLGMLVRSLLLCLAQAGVADFHKKTDANIVTTCACFLALLLRPLAHRKESVFFRRVRAKARRRSTGLKTSVQEQLRLSSLDNVMGSGRSPQTPQSFISAADLVSASAEFHARTLRLICMTV